MVKLERRTANLGKTLEGITLSLEEEANTVVTYMLRKRGFKVSTKPIRIR